MTSQLDWAVKFKIKEGCKEAVKVIQKGVYEASYDGGATEIEHFMENVLDISPSELGEGWRDADTHCLGTLGVLALPQNLWNKGMSLSSRCFLSGTSVSDDTLSVYYYGPDGCEDLMNMIIENCEYLESYEVTGGEEDDEEDCDNEY